MPLTLQEFIATAATPTAAYYAELAASFTEAGSVAPPQASCTLYAEHGLIHVEGGLHYVHAWWYPPVGYATLAEAQLNLHHWYLEFA